MEIFAIGLSPVVQCHSVAPHRILASANGQDQAVFSSRGEDPAEPGGLPGSRRQPWCANPTRETSHPSWCSWPSRPSITGTLVPIDGGRAIIYVTGGDDVADVNSSNLTLNRGLDILEFLAAAGSPMPVDAIRLRTGIPASSVYRILRSLIDRGWATLAADGRYTPGPRFVGLAGALRLDHWIAAVAPPKMQKLAEATDETVLLTVITGHFALCVAGVEGSQLVRATLEPGTLLPLHSGASSLVLLASAPKDLTDAVLARPLARYAGKGQVDPEKLRRRLTSIRADGHVVTTGEVDAGLTAIAVPVPLERGSSVFQLIGPIGLSVVGPSGRLRGTLHADILVELQKCAREIANAVTAMF